MLNSSDTREQIYRYVEELSQERLAVVLDFLSYLLERDNSDATAKLLAIPRFATEPDAAEQEANVDDSPTGELCVAMYGVKLTKRAAYTESYLTTPGSPGGALRLMRTI